MSKKRKTKNKLTSENECRKTKNELTSEKWMSKNEKQTNFSLLLLFFFNKFYHILHKNII